MLRIHALKPFVTQHFVELLLAPRLLLVDQGYLIGLPHEQERGVSLWQSMRSVDIFKMGRHLYFTCSGRQTLND